MVKKYGLTNIDDNFRGISHTFISFILTNMAFIIMLYLGFEHINDEDFYGVLWGQFALYQAAFAFMGSWGVCWLNGILIPNMRDFKEFNVNSAFMGFGIFVGLVLVQLIVQTVLSITTTDRALYVIFASIAEESFFRGFLFEIPEKFGKKSEIMYFLTIIVSTGLFTYIHKSYYSDPIAIMAVIVSGIFLGLIYVVTGDITANIIGHFILNVVYSFQSILGWGLAGEPSNFMMFLIFGIFMIVFGLFLYSEKRKEVIDERIPLKTLKIGFIVSSIFTLFIGLNLILEFFDINLILLIPEPIQ